MNQNGSNGSGKTSLGLDENIAGLLCYLGVWLTGIIFFFIEKDSKFVKFHALQSFITFLSLSIVSWILEFIPIIRLLTIPLGLLTFVLWIILMIKAYQKEWFKLPIIGDIVEKQINQ